MLLFLVAISIVFLSTGVCALVEAALYAVRRPDIRQLAEAGHPSGALLTRFKERMDYPISAILIFDTVLGVGGAAIAGAQAHAIFGPDFVIWFSIGLSVVLLIVSQIIPKILGVVYSKPVARVSAPPISVAISMLYPVIWIIERFTRYLKPDDPIPSASEDEVRQMARISVEEGSILGVEADLIQNSLKLNDVRAAEIMTPMDKVVSLPADMEVKDAFATFHNRSLSRIPLHRPADVNCWNGLVFSRDILSEMAKDHHHVKLETIAKPIHFVDAGARGHVLLNEFLVRRSHLFGVRNEDKRNIGVVSLEDVIEEILGKEIVDEREKFGTSR